MVAPAIRGFRSHPDIRTYLMTVRGRDGSHFFAERDQSAASSFTKPMASSAGRISGFAMNRFHTSPVR